jgi:cytochrome c5
MLDIRTPLLLICLSLLCACSGDSEPMRQLSGPTTPADARVAELYNRSCRSCHAQGAGWAPKTGDLQAWAPRLQKGTPVLLEHTIDGFKGMPPMGMCFDCNEEDFTKLISFMSGG